MAMASEETLVLRPQNPVKKQSFLCDLIPFVYFLKGQCPSLKEAEAAVRNLQSDRKKNDLMCKSSTTSRARSGLKESSTKQKTVVASTRTSTGKNCWFTCYSSPVEKKKQSARQSGMSLSEKSANCENIMATQGTDVGKPSKLAVGIDNGFAKQKNGRDQKPASLSQLRNAAQQQRSLSLLAEVADAVLHSDAGCQAMLLAFGSSLVSLTHAMLVEFVAAEEAEAEGDNDSGVGDMSGDAVGRSAAAAAAAAKSIFGQLMSLPELSESLPVTSMHVLLKSQRPPAAPFRQRPRFRPPPACRLLRVALPDRRLRDAVVDADAPAAAAWFYSATVVPGFSIS